jgi:hypothetical protein
MFYCARRGENSTYVVVGEIGFLEEGDKELMERDFGLVSQRVRRCCVL